VKGTLGGDLAPYLLAAFTVNATACLYIAAATRGKPDSLLVSLSHSLAQSSLLAGLTGWIPLMLSIKAHSQPPTGYPATAAFITGAVVLLAGLSLIYQYILYGLTWLMDKMQLFKD